MNRLAIKFYIQTPGTGILINNYYSNLRHATDYFGWFYLLSVFIIIIFLLVLAISKYGKIRLGGKDARPEFKFHTWIVLLFGAGLGIGLVFWGGSRADESFCC